MRTLRNGCLAFGVALFATACFDKDKLSGTVQTLELIARKDYTPVRFTDGVYQFSKDTKFQIPTRIEVLHGNAGNHKSHLFFKKQKDKKESSCEYQSGSSQAEPKGQKELEKAKFYNFVKCDDGSKAEDVATAQDLRLRVENGGDSKASKYTQVKAVISYEAGAAPTPTATPSPFPTPRVTPTVVPTALPTATPTPDIFAGLPPDPGEAGRVTLQGIDADNDGVRDDVQRFIKASYPHSLPQRSAATQLAKGILASLREAEPTTPEVHTWAARELRSSECMTFLFGFDRKWQEKPKIMQAVLNTDARNRAHLRWMKHMGGFYGSLTPRTEKSSTCEFNTSEQ